MTNSEPSDPQKLRRTLDELKEEVLSAKKSIQERSSIISRLESRIRKLESRLERVEEQKDEEEGEEEVSFAEVLPDESEEEEEKEQEQDKPPEETAKPKTTEPENEPEVDQDTSGTTDTEEETGSPPVDQDAPPPPEPPEPATLSEPPDEPQPSSQSSDPVGTEEQETELTDTPDAGNRRKNVSMLERAEDYLTGQGYLVIGVIALLFASGFLLKMAHDRDWFSGLLTDTHKVIIGTVLGLVVIGVGEYLVKIGRGYFARGIFGLALIWLYFIFYVGMHYFQVFPQTMAGFYMILVTCAGVVLAIRHNSQLIAQLSLIGGFLTPWFISTGSAKTIELFSYISVLLLGFLSLSWWKRWASLDITAQLGAFSIYIGWFFKHYSKSEFAPALLFFWVFYGLLAASAFLKYRDSDEESSSSLIKYPYTTLPVVASLVLLFLTSGDRPDGFFLYEKGFSTMVLGGSFFFLSSFLSRDEPDRERRVQYVTGLILFALGLLPWLMQTEHPTLAVTMALGTLHAGYQGIRLWQNEAYFQHAVPRSAISVMTYLIFCIWFLARHPGESVGLPLLVLSGLFLVDHLAASWRFLFLNEDHSFPVHHALSIILFFTAGTVLLSGIEPGTPDSIREIYPFFCYAVATFLLIEQWWGVRDRSRSIRLNLQVLFTGILILVPLYQAHVLDHAWYAILPTSALFFLLYEGMLYHLEIEEDWLVGASGFGLLTIALFSVQSLQSDAIYLQLYAGLLLLSFLRIPHLKMNRRTEAVQSRDRWGVWILFIAMFIAQQMFLKTDRELAKGGSWGLVYLALILGYQLYFFKREQSFRLYTPIAWVLAVFAHLHLLFQISLDTVEAWVILFPFLVLILFAGEIELSVNGNTDKKNEDTPSLRAFLFLYAVPVFAYSLFAMDFVLYQFTGIPQFHSAGHFQDPLVHEVMLTFVMLLIGGGPIWKKIRRDQGIHRQEMILFQISLIFFYIASFVVADQFQTAADWIVPALLAPVMFGAAYLMSSKRYDDPKQKQLYLVNGFLMVTHGILLAFDHQYQTLFLALDIAVFFTLARVYRWKWVDYGSCWAGVLFAVHFTWSIYDVQSTYPGVGFFIAEHYPSVGFNHYFLARCGGLLLMGTVPYMIHKKPGWEREQKFPLFQIGVLGVALGAFYLGNLKIFSYFGWEEQMLDQHRNPFMYSLSALWGTMGMVYFLSGFLGNNRLLRLLGSLLVLITTIKVFFFDLQVEMVYRVLSFATIGVVLLLINYVYRSYIKPDQPEESGP